MNLMHTHNLKMNEMHKPASASDAFSSLLTPHSSLFPPKPTMLKQPILLLAALILAMLAGCQTTYTDFEAFVRDPQPLVTSTEYRLAPPDVIRITSKRVRELHGHVETIRPDGRITLPLIGAVMVTGKTPEEASIEIQNLAVDFYEDADVSLRVEVFRSKKIFVFGEVRIVGAYPYDGTNTVLRTLAIAQPTRLADPCNIQVMRPNRNGEMIKRMTIDLNEMVQRGDTTLDAVLEEGDILYVPPNPLASVGLAFQQLLLPLQPAAATIQAPTDIATHSAQKPYTSGGE